MVGKQGKRVIFRAGESSELTGESNGIRTEENGRNCRARATGVLTAGGDLHWKEERRSAAEDEMKKPPKLTGGLFSFCTPGRSGKIGFN